MTLDKVLDGDPLLYHLATKNASSADLSGRSNKRASVAISIFSDAQQSCSGTPLSQVVCSGMYVSQVTYDIKVEGNATENVTLVGNNKVWLASGFTFTGQFNNNDTPTATEGVNRRQHIQMGLCKFPTDIRGITSSGTNNKVADQGELILDYPFSARI
ncbi:MAG: hypothetical protein K2R98_19560 [Gemmataceae bacterium]|nr:hypothetical protein [Gemmataceae bacterium]